MKIILNNFRPLSVNLLYRTLRGGKLYKSSRYRDFLNSIITKFPKRDSLIQIPIKINLQFYLKTRRNCDVDNLLKWLDVWNGLIWVDDKQIIRISATKHIDSNENMTLMTIRNYETGHLINHDIIEINL